MSSKESSSCTTAESHTDVDHADAEQAVHHLDTIPQHPLIPWRVTPKKEPQQQQESGGRRRRILFGILLVSLLAVPGVVLTVVFVQRNQDQEDSSPTGGFSLFQNPSTVEWKRRGQVIRDPAEGHWKNEGDKGKFAWHSQLSADGTRFVVATRQRGYALVYHYGETTQQWKEHTRFSRSAQEQEQDLANDGEVNIGENVAMAGNGKCLAIKGDQVVYIYEYDDTTDTWVPHDQPILEYQAGDMTGSAIAFNYDGSLLAVGSSAFQGTTKRAGLIRFFERSEYGTWALSGRINGSEMGQNLGTSFDGAMRLSRDGRTLVQSNALIELRGLVWVWRRLEGTDDDDWRLLGSPFKGAHLGARQIAVVDISDDGNVVAIFVEQLDGKNAVFVYEFIPGVFQQEKSNDLVHIPGRWSPRGDPLNVSNPQGCLGANGNIVVTSGMDGSEVFQYDAKNGSWTQGGPFEQIKTFHGGFYRPKITCAADGRTFATAIGGGKYSNPLSPDESRVGTVTFCEAEEQ